MNADGLLDASSSIGLNLFAYCGNHPQNNCDPTGSCYFNAKGEWCHDKREYIGNYQRLPNPAVDVKTTSKGKAVIISEGCAYSSTNDAIRIVDNRAKSNQNPSIQIRNSYKITDEKEQKEILNILLNYNRDFPSDRSWKRTINSMIIEWDAHNDVYAVKHNERCQHVDLDNNDEGVPYFGFWERAIREGVKSIL